LGWPYGAFEVPAAIRQAWDGRTAGAAAEAGRNELVARYRASFPELAGEYERRMQSGPPGDWAVVRRLLSATTSDRLGAIATPKSSQNRLDLLVERVPELL